MTKKHFIALANAFRATRPEVKQDIGHEIPFVRGQQYQWELTREVLADFCSSQNPRFNRQRWLDYVAGKCGSGGGKIKAAKQVNARVA